MHSMYTGTYTYVDTLYCCKLYIGGLLVGSARVRSGAVARARSGAVARARVRLGAVA